MALLILVVMFMVLCLFGIPIVISMLGSSVVYLSFISPDNLLQIAHRMYYGLDNFALLAVPFFLLVGELMNRTGLTWHLVRLADVVVGRLTGGLAQVNIVASLFMAGVSGIATSDVASISTIMIPAMEKDGYTKEFSAAITSASSTIGPIFPPSLPMVVLGAMGGVSVGALFIAGIIPGILMAIFMMIYTHFYCKKQGGFENRKERSGLRHDLIVVKQSLGAILIPLIILGGILIGLFTPTEAGNVAIFAVLIIAALESKLTFKIIKESIQGTIRILGPIMLITAAASIFGNILNQERVGEVFISFIYMVTDSPIIAMLIIAVILLILGCFIEVLALLILATPIFLPIAMTMGIDPIHFSLVMILAIQVGLITPPMGICMYVTCSIAKIKIGGYTRAVLPFLGVIFLLIVLMIIFKPITLFLPNLLMG